MTLIDESDTDRATMPPSCILHWKSRRHTRLVVSCWHFPFIRIILVTGVHCRVLWWLLNFLGKTWLPRKSWGLSILKIILVFLLEKICWDSRRGISLRLSRNFLAFENENWESFPRMNLLENVPLTIIEPPLHSRKTIHLNISFLRHLKKLKFLIFCQFRAITVNSLSDLLVDVTIIRSLCNNESFFRTIKYETKNHKPDVICT